MSAERHLARAEAALQLRRWEEAAREAAQVISLDPSGAGGYAMLSRAHLGKSEFGEALRLAEDGLARDPQSEWLHRLRCHALRLLDRHAEALEAAETCVRLEPNASETHAVRGKVLAALKRPAEAQAAYDRALELNPDDATLHRALGNLLLEEDPAGAEACYRRALAIDASDPEALNNLGVALNRQRRPDEAALAFKAAILADPALTIAKQNAHATVSSQLGAALGVGGAVFLLFRVWHIALSATSQNSAVTTLFLSLIAIAAATAFVSRRVVRRARLGRLKERDPQLYAIFRKLDADKQAGRL